jgi:predicted AAA+ superfamily ATPase
MMAFFAEMCHHDGMLQRRLERPKSSFFLLGPRGTGKTTWVRAELPRAHRIDLLDESRYQSYLVDPGRFAAELRAAAIGSWVVVDEVQRLPGLLNEVHRAIEERRLRFALTGSSARKLRRGGTNLLGGRATQLTMFPFVPEELGSDFRLERALQHGTLPLVWDADEPEATLRAYVQTYLKEEIQAEGAARNLGGFARFLPIAGLMHAQSLNIASLARDAGVARQTVTGYVQILEDTLLAATLGSFQARLRVRERRHPKFYLVDPGIARAVKGHLGPLTSEERGALFEGFVFMLLRFYRERAELFDDVGYWAPAEAHATEVDFVISRRQKKAAIEVKATRVVRPADLRGLRALSDLPGLKRRVLIYLGGEILAMPDGIEAWPFPHFARTLADGTFWP